VEETTAMAASPGSFLRRNQQAQTATPTTKLIPTTIMEATNTNLTREVELNTTHDYSNSTNTTGHEEEQATSSSSSSSTTNFISFTWRPLPEQRRPQIAVYYYSWWGNPNNTHWDKGYLRATLEQPQLPWLGEYASQDAATIAQHLEWFTQYGITQMIASWFGSDRYGDEALRDYVLPALSDQADSDSNNIVKLCILYESRGALVKNATDKNRIYFDNTLNNNEQRLMDDFSYLATHYFSHPNYLTVQHENIQKAVVYLYLSRSYRGDYTGAFARMRLHIREKFGYELYLVAAGEVSWRKPPDLYAEDIYYDAISTYNMYGRSRYEGYPDDSNFFVDLAAKYEEWRVAANAVGIPLIPNAMPAYNDRGARLPSPTVSDDDNVNGNNGNYAWPHERNAELAGSSHYSTFAESLRVAHQVLQSQTAAGVFGGDDGGLLLEPTIAITSWNEWSEDTSIEPTQGTAGASFTPDMYTQGYVYQDYGFGLLEVLQTFLQQFDNQINQATTTTISAVPTSNETSYTTNATSAFDGSTDNITDSLTHNNQTFLQQFNQNQTTNTSTDPTNAISYTATNASMNNINITHSLAYNNTISMAEPIHNQTNPDDD
jgi:hypothetical protein